MIWHSLEFSFLYLLSYLIQKSDQSSAWSLLLVISCFLDSSLLTESLTVIC